MSKDKERCKHGFKPVYMTGCPICVDTAMTALHIIEDNGWTIEELWQLLHYAFPNKEALDVAVATVREKIKKRDAQKRKV